MHVQLHLSIRRSKLNQILITYLTCKVCSRNSRLTLLLKVHSDGLLLVSGFLGSYIIANIGEIPRAS